MTYVSDAVQRMFVEDDHPRDPKGSNTGGQFTASPKSSESKRRPTKSRPSRKPDRGSSVGDAALFYDPKTGRGTGYGRSGGDARVRRLQEALNRLGIRDSKGRELKVDGKLGPLTTQAIKEAQTRLGVDADGRVDTALLRKITGSKSLSKTPEKPKRRRNCVCRSESDCVCPEDGHELEVNPRMTVVERADPDKPYGDVAYADPGYQEDGKKRYPIDTEEHCRAAWSYINQAGNAAKYSPEEVSKIKGRIKAAGKKYGIEFSDDTDRSAGEATVSEILRYERCWALDDIAIRSTTDGRTVEAYAAVFDTPSEIKDQHGHYLETIHRSAFNRAISHGIERIQVYYHHGMTIHNTPSDLGSVPIGSPLEVRPDGRGLRTVSRLNKSQLADSVLEAIRNGDIKGYSFRGRIFQSNPTRIPRSRGGDLPTVTRMELGLTEYGPTPTPAYADAGILAVRAQAAAATLAALDPTERAELVRLLAVPTPLDPETDTATPDVGPGTEDSPDGRSGRNKAKIAEILGDLHAQGVL